MAGREVFSGAKEIDAVGKDNKFFKQQLKKIKKNPLYSVDYKREAAIMNAKSIREKAAQESKELKELERKKIIEKRDIFMTRELEMKKRKEMVGNMKRREGLSKSGYALD